MAEHKKCRTLFHSFFSSLISHPVPGVLLLVLVYTVMGSILFVSLEGELDDTDGIETAASKPYLRNNDLLYDDLRTK
jgi:hypothetical protein